jgi:threonyl-tRNA synthetase
MSRHALYLRTKERAMDESDHRVIGNRLDLFHQQEEAPGMAFWHPRGFARVAVAAALGAEAFR